MFLRKMVELQRKLAFRLTLWYAAIFTLTACIAFVVFYILFSSMMVRRSDQDLIRQADEFSATLSLQGVDALKRAAIFQAQAGGEKKLFIRLLYPTGVAFSSSNMAHWRSVNVNRLMVSRLLRGEDDLFETVQFKRQPGKVRIIYSMIGNGIILQLGQSLEADLRLLETVRTLFAGSLSAMLLLAAGVGWFMARRAVSSIERVTRTAAEIAAGRLKKRVPTTRRGDEVDQLAVTFNQMLDRIEKLVNEMQEMSDNIAHDLRSPITRLRGLAEVTLTGSLAMADYQEMAASTIEECDRLLEMINTMLMISRTEAGVGELHGQPFDWTVLVGAAVELFRPLAEEKQLSITRRLPQTCPGYGELPLIQRMIANLLDNAIKYTPAGGTVKVVLECAEDGKGPVKVTVADNGIGITDQDLPHIFERFYRCDQSRSHSGSGLGLSLSRAIARAHHGNITVQSRTGQGSRFTVVLPSIPAPSERSVPLPA